MGDEKIIGNWRPKLGFSRSYSIAFSTSLFTFLVFCLFAVSNMSSIYTIFSIHIKWMYIIMTILYFYNLIIIINEYQKEVKVFKELIKNNLILSSMKLSDIQRNYLVSYFADKEDLIYKLSQNKSEYEEYKNEYDKVLKKIRENQEVENFIWINDLITEKINFKDFLKISMRGL